MTVSLRGLLAGTSHLGAEVKDRPDWIRASAPRNARS